MFHVKHQNRGFFFGVPDGLGYTGGVGEILRKSLLGHVSRETFQPTQLV